MNALIEWLETQDPKTEYKYWASDCLIWRYLSAKGMPREQYGDVLSASERTEIAKSRPHTFGAALERAKALMTEQ